MAKHDFPAREYDDPDTPCTLINFPDLSNSSPGIGSFSIGLKSSLLVMSSSIVLSIFAIYLLISIPVLSILAIVES